MAKQKTAVVLCNLGAAETDTKTAISTYLGRLLTDRQLVKAWSMLGGLLLKLLILPTLSKKYLRALTSLPPEPDSNYLAIAQRQQQALQQKLGSEIKVELMLRYSKPDFPQVIDQLLGNGYRRLIVLPLLPQHSLLSATCSRQVSKLTGEHRDSASVSIITDYHGDPGYIHALASSVQEHWRQQQRQRFLLIAFAALPAASDDAGDPYYDQCLGSANLLATILGLSYSQWALGFSSFHHQPTRLEPTSTNILTALAAQGLKEVDVICPGFASDCLETRVQVQAADRDTFLAHGGEQYHYIACLNTRNDHIDMMAQLVRPYLQAAD